MLHGLSYSFPQIACDLGSRSSYEAQEEDTTSCLQKGAGHTDQLVRPVSSLRAPRDLSVSLNQSLLPHCNGYGLNGTHQAAGLST